MELKKIAIITARAGSKGLPNKNILMLLDKPLIAYTIEAALASELFDKVIVSTDSLEYKYIAEQYGAEVMLRSEELSSDLATSFMVIEDVLNKTSHCDYFVLLQPTSPFRNASHIKEAVSLYEKNKTAKFLVSVVESDKSASLIKPLDDNLTLKNFEQDFSNYRRQNSKEYAPNGAIFIGEVDAYRNRKHFFGADSIAYVMNKKDSIDIDDRLDFEMAIFIQSQNIKRKILTENIKKRIEKKRACFERKCQITLIGHSIFDNWNLTQLNGVEVNNLGIAGISSEEYFKLIMEKELIKGIGDTVILLLGSNDIVLGDWHEKFTLFWINKIIQKLKMINSNVKIYFLAVPPVLGRIERDNKIIKNLNENLEKEIKKYSFANWVPFSLMFYDHFGNLKKNYTYDGLHFSSEAYRQLEKELSGILK